MIVFIPMQIFLIKFPRREFIKILLGTAPVYIGLLIFLSGIDFGFAFAGEYIGEVFLDPRAPSGVPLAATRCRVHIGCAITLSEPAVTVLEGSLRKLLTVTYVN